MTVESFDHLARKHVTPAYSRLDRHKKNVYPTQLRRDYREDIHEQLRQGLIWMHDTPQLVIALFQVYMLINTSEFITMWQSVL